MLSRKKDQLQPIRHAKFLEDACDVAFDHLFADPKPHGNFSVGQPRNHQRDDLQLNLAKLTPLRTLEHSNPEHSLYNCIYQTLGDENFSFSVNHIILDCHFRSCLAKLLACKELQRNLALQFVSVSP